jgi:lipopolysaccharide export LptBFGC system permease protein LptF
VVVFGGYDLVVVAGEAFADRMLLSPFVAMWMANAVLLAVALVLVRHPRRPGPTRGAETFALDA